MDAGRFVSVQEADKLGKARPMRVTFDFSLVSEPFVCTEAGMVVDTCKVWNELGMVRITLMQYESIHLYIY